MKKSIFTIVIWIGILMSMSAQQSECKFPMDSTIWSQREFNNWVIIGTTNDTIIDGLTYYKLYEMLGPDYSPEDVYIGAIRKEGFKIYLKYGDNEEILLYDFAPIERYTYRSVSRYYRPTIDWEEPYNKPYYDDKPYVFYCCTYYYYTSKWGIDAENNHYTEVCSPTAGYDYIIWNEQYGSNAGFFGNFLVCSVPTCCHTLSYNPERAPGELFCVKQRDTILYKSERVQDCMDTPPLDDFYFDVKLVDQIESVFHDDELSIIQQEDYLKILGDNIQQTTLYNLEGKFIATSTDKELAIKGLKGVYLMQVVQNQQNKTLKVYLK